MSQYVFHVRHNSRPELIEAYVDLISEYPGVDDETLLAYGAAQGSRIGTDIRSAQNLRENVAQCLRDFGLLEPKQSCLTEQGTRLRDVMYAKPALLAEVIHYLFYSTWQPSAPSKYCFSWSYAATVRLLWSSAQATINQKQLATDIAAQAKEAFPDAKVSFSEDSVRGVMNWLRPLSPAVIHERNGSRHFTRRSFCPPELFILAVDYAYRIYGVNYGSNLLLEPNVQETICQVCVLEPEGFERVVGYAALQFPFLAQGMGGGWGSYLRLDRAPQLDDLL